MKKILVSLMLIAVAVPLFLVTGCVSGKYDLRVLTWRVEDGAYYDWMVAEFEKKYDVKVQFDAVSTDAYNSISMSSLTGESVDVFQAQTAYYSNDNYTVHMQDLSDMTDLISRMKESIAQDDKNIDGKTYMISLNTVNEVVFYNKAIFKDLSLSIPTTYPEFQSVMKTLKNNVGKTINGEKLVAPIIYGGKDGWPANMIFDTLEATIVRAADPDFYLDVWKNETKDFKDPLYLDLFSKMIDIGKYTQENALGLAYNRCPGLFAKGGYAMLIDGTWSYAEIVAANPDLDFGAFAMPGNNDAQYNNIVPTKSGSSWAIRKGTPKLDLAKKFLEFQMSETVYKKYLDMTKFSSVLKDVHQDDPKVADLYSYENTVLTFGNYLIPAMKFDMNTVIGPNVMGGRTTAAGACNILNEGCVTTKEQWSKKLDEWLGRFFPEALTA